MKNQSNQISLFISDKKLICISNLKRFRITWRFQFMQISFKFTWKFAYELFQLGLYYGVSICLVSFASGLSVVTLNLHHRGLRGTEVPYVVRKVVLGGLARLVLLSFDAPKMRQTNGETHNSRPTCNCNDAGKRRPRTAGDFHSSEH